MTEQEFVDALAAAVAPVPVRWGWHPLETAEQPPGLPVITVQRVFADLEAFTDMCDPTTGERIGNVTLDVHTWAREYEEARNLQKLVRGATGSDRTYKLTTESDTFEQNFRAWQIASSWRGDGVALE